MKDALFRGVMIGGALGIMATFFLHWDPPRAFAFGVVAGFFAGLTKYHLENRKKKR